MSVVQKRYLGDGVYAGLNNGRVVLACDEGDFKRGMIVLEPDVLEALVEYMIDRDVGHAALRKARETNDET